MHTTSLLMDLGIPAHKIGYKALTIAIPHYTPDALQSFTKELYPVVSAHLPGTSPTTVEAAIRRAIAQAWTHRTPEVWNTYFPHQTKAPSNANFIATLAEFIKE